MRMFQQKYLNKGVPLLHNNELKYGIPILSNKDDNFIRSSYYGGATDYYKAYGENLYYYDVNSLYPYAMLNDMPLTIIKTYNHVQSQNINLNSFFGFLHVEIECPLSVSRPMLPYKLKGITMGYKYNCSRKKNGILWDIFIL